MKINNKYKIIFVIYLTLSLFLLAGECLAQVCSEAYPNDGECQASCDEGTAMDSTKALCPENQVCCHKCAPPANVTLQVPLFDYKVAYDLAEYIGKIYQYSLFVIIPIAIFVIIYAGIRWLTSGGDSSKIKEAKNYITGAILGIIISLLGLYVLALLGINKLSMSCVAAIPASTDEVQENTPIETNPTYGSIGGQCFPVASDSFSYISWNYGNRRQCGSSGFRRCHGGIDIYTKSPGNIVAMADGKILGLSKTFYTCKGGWGAKGVPSAVGKIMIQHGDYTVNYGEIDADKFAPGIAIGASVRAGQYLGQATYCGMLHFELYQGSLGNNIAWPPAGSCLSQDLPQIEHICNSPTYLPQKPGSMLDPTNTLKALQSKMCSKT